MEKAGPDHTHSNVSKSHTWVRIHTGYSYTGSSWAYSPRDFYLSSLQTETVKSLIVYSSNKGTDQNNIRFVHFFKCSKHLSYTWVPDIES